MRYVDADNSNTKDPNVARNLYKETSSSKKANKTDQFLKTYKTKSGTGDKEITVKTKSRPPKDDTKEVVASRVISEIEKKSKWASSKRHQKPFKF